MKLLHHKPLLITVVGLITVLCFNSALCDIFDKNENFEEFSDNFISSEDEIIENYDENVNHVNRHRHKSKQNHLHNRSTENFLLTDYLMDGEMERRISFNGLTAKETSLGNNSKSISLWQLSDGKAFLQVIFTSEHQLIDCEYVRQRDLVKHFLQKFYQEVSQSKAHNFSTSYLNNIPHRHHHPHLSDHEFRQFIDNGVLASELEDFASNGLTDEKFEDEAREYGLRNAVYKKLNDENDLPEELRRWMDVRALRVMCNKRHRQMKQLAAAINGDNESERTEAEEHLNRKKRDLSSMLRIPGTKWCGAGWSATKYAHLGGLSRADRCCRKHDTTCPYWILGFETKYGLFNWRVGTLMHCSCDERFRTCLKMADSADANMVGRVFFNVLQTKCFVLKPEKICKERSWWGQCTKKGMRKRAHIRDNRKF
ncbi:uncharacterized protein LOC134832017 isoform X1 [Culicoides brevitarsis]|uniref:uncharacterized protein LOC134832017 isoform X1 n=1 Tax=Culicoides brevitarsis TaxID=469753 RepID=UPI00307BF631